jgi:hypothetical protein
VNNDKHYIFKNGYVEVEYVLTAEGVLLYKWGYNKYTKSNYGSLEVLKDYADKHKGIITEVIS